MICPHCNKEIPRESFSNLTKDMLYDEICKDVHSIASLSRETGMKRSSMIFYLDKLIEEKKIVYEKLKNVQGQPTLIRKNPSFVNSTKKENKGEN